MGKHAGHFVEKTKVFHLLSRKINLKFLANRTCPIKPKTFGQKLRKKRMDLGLQVKDLAKYFDVNQDTIINWELRNVKQSWRNLRTVERFLELNKQNSGFSTKISAFTRGEMLCGYPLSALDRKR